jgi:hypothetical protein
LSPDKKSKCKNTPASVSSALTGHKKLVCLVWTGNIIVKKNPASVILDFKEQRYSTMKKSMNRKYENIK